MVELVSEPPSPASTFEGYNHVLHSNLFDATQFLDGTDEIIIAGALCKKILLCKCHILVETQA
jgi:hypothetical protein